MKKTVTYLSALFLLGILFFAVSFTAEAAAEDYTVSSDGNYKYGVIDESAKTIRLNRCDIVAEDIYIPDEIDGYRVIEIGRCCMMNNDVTKTVHLGKNVQSVLGDAFYGLIKHEAFTVAEDNPYLTVKDSVLYDITGTKLIRCPQFYQTDVFTVTDDVTEICAGAFAFYSQAYQEDGHYYYGYQKIKEIRLPNSLTKINSNAFNGSYITKLYIPDSVTQVTELTFVGLDYCKSIYLGAGVSAEAGIGLNSSALQRIAVSPDNPYLTVENNVLFSKDKSVLYCYPGAYDDNTAYCIPDGVKILERKAFNYSNLSSVDFNEVEIIREGAFNNSHVLLDWVVPKTVSSFRNVTNLLSDKTCSFTFLNPDCVIAISWFSFNKYNITIYGFPGSTAEEYVKKNKNTNVTLTFVPLHTLESDADIYSYVHSYAASMVLPTCTEQGYTLQKCSVCGLSYKENIQEPLGHNYVVAATIIPTCTEQGYTVYQCSRCDSSFTDSYTEASGHTFVKDNAVSATCIAEGKTEGEHCAVCGLVVTEQKTVEKTAHTYSGYIEVSPSCTSQGVMRYTCSFCGKAYTETIEKTEHSYIPALCEKAGFNKDGSLEYRCAFCSDVLKTEKLSAISSIRTSSMLLKYTGEAISIPQLIVTDSDGKLIDSSNYTVKCFSRSDYTEVNEIKEVGQYKLQVDFSGNYEGSRLFYLSVVPGAVSQKKPKAGKGSVKIRWNKSKAVSGYQIVIAENKKFTKNVKRYNVKSARASRLIKGLKSKKRYYIKIRSYKIVKVEGKKTKMYSDFSKKKSVKTK